MCYKAVDSYINFLLNNKRKSLNTEKAYKRALIEFHNFISNKNSDVIFDRKFYQSISLIDLDNFIAYLNKEKKNSASTINQKGTIIKEFGKYLKRIGYLKENIFEDVELPEIPQRLHVTLTEEEAIRLLNAVKSDTSKFKIRNTAIILTFLTTGVRVSELCDIEPSNIRENTLYVIGKGNKERKIYLPDSTLKVLEEYLEFKKKNNLENTKYLFVSKTGSQLKTPNIDDLIKKYCQLAGINKNISAHKLRHSFASISHNVGNVDIRSLQELLGHSSIKTTQIYVSVNDEKLKDSINKNPLAHIL